MDIDWLHTFVMAADEGNFHRTADKLHLAQPTVTLHIQKIEAILGSSLFDRIGKSVQLNAAGRRFLPSAKKLLVQYAQSVEEIVRLSQGYEEMLRIAVSPIVATTWLPRYIEGFSKLYPNVEFSIQVLESRPVIDCLIAGDADFGLSRIPVSHPKLHCDRLYDDPVVLAVPHDGRDHDAPPRTALEILQAQTVFVNNHPGYWGDLLPALRLWMPRIRTMHVSLVHVSLEWIRAGLGVSFLPLSTVRHSLLRGNVEEISFTEFPLPTASTYFIRPKSGNSYAGVTSHRLSNSDVGEAFANYVSMYMAMRQ